MSNLALSPKEVDYLLSPLAIRDRAADIFRYTNADKGYFAIEESKFASTVKTVMDTIYKNYPTLAIPFHSRWGHFRVGGVDRVKEFELTLAKFDPMERARIKLDLVVTSVLLDAGAGPTWSFLEEITAKIFSRSEGLGVASYYMFLAGAMSVDRKSLRADAVGLKNISVEDIQKAFQVSEKNPLVGVEGRCKLLNNLGTALENRKIFRNERPGNLLDYLEENHGKNIPAKAILRAVLDGFGAIWPGRLSANGVNLGDVWQHSKLSSVGGVEILVPFHKLSQWMTYSLIEPIQEAGFTVSGVEELTGLAEYRNGGLFVDSGFLRIKNPADADKSWRPDSEFIIEWRALTIHSLDRIGAEVQKALGKKPADFPLAKVLEGGTWWAGRFLAKEKRSNGEPPIKIESDGTVF